MTTRFHRLQLTLDPELEIVLRGISELRGRPQASIVREWLAEATPALRSVLEAMYIVRDGPKMAARAIQELGERVEAHGRQTGLDLRRRAGRPRKRG